MGSESTVRKKIVAVHFTKMPCKPNRAYKAQRKPHFCNIYPCSKDIVQPRFEDFVTFLYVFMNVVKVFRALAKNYG